MFPATPKPCAATLCSFPKTAIESAKSSRSICSPTRSILSAWCFWKRKKCNFIRQRGVVIINRYSKLFSLLGTHHNVNIPSFLEALVSFLEHLPQNAQSAAEQWANYGWAPNFPWAKGADFIGALLAPNSQEAADEKMLSILDHEKQLVLFQEIEALATRNNGNVKTLSDAIGCFQAGFYTACSLSLFALIDGCLIVKQPRGEGRNNRRQLTEKVMKNIKKPKIIKYLVPFNALIMATKNFFDDADDFNPEKEGGLNRNFASHGMNQYNPTRTDCLKLFVLLYNFYFLIDAKLLRWNGATFEYTTPENPAQA